MESCLFNITGCLTIFYTILTWFYFSSDANSKENLVEEQVVKSTRKSVTLTHQEMTSRHLKQEKSYILWFIEFLEEHQRFTNKGVCNALRHLNHAIFFQQQSRSGIKLERFHAFHKQNDNFISLFNENSILLAPDLIFNLKDLWSYHEK